MYLKLSIITVLLVASSTGYLLPNPPGRYNVTLKTGDLTDHSRDGRKLMLSVFHPATCASTEQVPYMPNTTAKNEAAFLKEMFQIPLDLTPLLQGASLPVCPGGTLSACTARGPDRAPILLLSPGYRGTRLYYNVLASAIASEGITVITIDHPGETGTITYPDGTVAISNLPNAVDLDRELTPLAYIRAADASFIIDQLSNGTAMGNLLPRVFPLDHIAVAGHSLGGAASILAASQDPRISAAINLDGPTFGTLPPEGLSKPVLYVATDRPDLKGAEDPRVLASFPAFTGPKLWIRMSGAVHETILDFPTLFKAAGQNTTALAPLLGTIAAAESVRILAAFTSEWTNKAFAGQTDRSLLQSQELNQFPNVTVVRSGNL